MKKILLILFLMTLAHFGQAETPVPSTLPEPDLWTLKNEPIVIPNNGSLTLQVHISLDSSSNPQAPGVTIKNCRDTQQITASTTDIVKLKPGSTAVCYTRDGNNPIRILSDNPSVPVTGKTQIITTTQPIH